QLLKSLPISGSPSDQQFTYGLRRHAHKSLRRRELANDSLAGLPSQSHHHFRAPEFAGVLFGSQFSGPFAGAFPQLLVEGQMAGPWGKPLLDRVESFLPLQAQFGTSAAENRICCSFDSRAIESRTIRKLQLRLLPFLFLLYVISFV